jgi:hypothetical protein
MSVENNTDIDSVIHVLVDLDSIMDTRLPILYSIDENLAERTIKSGNYFKRYKDEFEYVTLDIFKPLYKDRTKNVLSLATPTAMLDTISDYCSEAILQNKVTGGDGKLIIYLNIYPYNLSHSEYDNLAKGLMYMIGDVEVKVVSMDKEELTPKWVDDNLAMLVLYDGLEWLEYHTAMLNIIKNPINNVALMVPATVIGNVKLTTTKASEIIKFFTDMEDMAKTLIKLKFIGVVNYCGMLKK